MKTTTLILALMFASMVPAVAADVATVSAECYDDDDTGGQGTVTVRDDLSADQHIDDPAGGAGALADGECARADCEETDPETPEEELEPGCGYEERKDHAQVTLDGDQFICYTGESTFTCPEHSSGSG